MNALAKRQKPVQLARWQIRVVLAWQIPQIAKPNCRRQNNQGGQTMYNDNALSTDVATIKPCGKKHKQTILKLVQTLHKTITM